jgi:uncharacterized membrane protein (UPF0182 family)
MLVAAVVIIGLFILLTATSSFWVNWWWFSSMDRRSLLTDRYIFQGLAFLIGAVIGGGLVGGNLILALRRTRQQPGSRRAVTRVSNRILFWLVIAVAAVVAIFTGAQASGAWQTWAKWVYGSSFGAEDPYFSRDIGFYIFALPAITWIYRGLLALTLLALIGAVVVYILRTSLRFSRDAIKQAPQTARGHVLALLGLLAIVIGLGRIIASFNTVYSSRGLVGGPGYTDMNITRWANLLAALLAFAVAVALFISARQLKFRFLVGSLAGLGIVIVLGVVALPVIVQSALVNPSELQRERSFIDNNLEMTRSAYALDGIGMRESSGQEPITAATLENEQETLENIRLWDYRIAGTTFQQLQSFVPYYAFPDVDVDQYTVDGQIVQVLTSAREMDQSGLPGASQNWTNTRLVYTHGYAAVVAPVGQVSEQGLPVMTVANIPPTGTGQFAITQPEIYFGDAPSGWIILNSDHDEFSGIDASEDATRYQGVPAGGIELGNIFKRIVLGAYLGDRNTVISGAVSGDSILLLDRSVNDRISKLTPFFDFDDDPYLVIADGKLYWVVDGYTVSDDYPAAMQSGGLNYIRNSVKVVVDAYTGEVTYYRTNTFDPIADAYGRMFDNLFEPISAAPPAIASHFRYPVRMFEIQSNIYSTAHVDNPTAYYNGEDRWSVATETIGGQVQTMEPYYVTMRLPGESATTYNLIRPFVPGGQTDRQNMTAWMTGRVTPEGQLELIVYRFPRQETVYGPRQIEGRISQEPEIASQLSLWNQSGTQVILGNMLVIPVEQSVLYVQPLYLQSTSVENALPELQRVIVATSENVVMRETLGEAISAAIRPDAAAVTEIETTAGEPVTPATAEETAPPAATEPTAVPAVVGDLAQQALDAYNQGREALAAGDWEAYGVAQDRLASLLQQMTAASTGTPVPEATPSP